MMRDVLLALAPGCAAALWWLGWGVAVQVLLGCVAALAAETLGLRLRGALLGRHLRDGSALVTGVLLALAVPPYAPWWAVPAGATFGILVAKHAYGGLGANVFNPAMAGYAFLVVSFPVALAGWPSAPAVFLHVPGAAEGLLGVRDIDAVSGATALTAVKTGLATMRMLSELESPMQDGLLGPPGWEWINAGFLLGGLWLLYRGVIGWRIPAAVLGSLALWALVFHTADADRYLSPVYHLFAGGSMLGAFFIATDPVSAPVTPRGRLLFGAGVGSLTWLLRTWGAHADGLAFAILLMNAAAPALERWTRPPVLGERR